MKVKRIIALALLFTLCLSIIAVAASGDTTVYITDTGEKYHRASCGSLWNSSHAVTLQQAINRGYEPCGRCHPPAYVTAQPSPSRSKSDFEYKPTPSPYKPPDILETTQTDSQPKMPDWLVVVLVIVFGTPFGWAFLWVTGQRIYDSIKWRRSKKRLSKKE